MLACCFFSGGDSISIIDLRYVCRAYYIFKTSTLILFQWFLFVSDDYFLSLGDDSRISPLLSPASSSPSHSNLLSDFTKTQCWALQSKQASLFAVGTGGGMSIKSMLQTPKGTQKRTKVSVLNSTFRRNFALVELGEVSSSGSNFVGTAKIPTLYSFLCVCVCYDWGWFVMDLFHLAEQF